MKTVQKLDYDRVASALVERGLLDPAALRDIQTQCAGGAAILPEILVAENLVSDWELSRLVCEIFNLAFLPVDHYEPAKEARAGIEASFLRQHCIVPLDRWGDLLTVAMPAISPADVLQRLEQMTKARILPVVGSVLGNRGWLEHNLPKPKNLLEDASPALPHAGGDLEVDGDWLGMFDAADASIQAAPIPLDEPAEGEPS